MYDCLSNCFYWRF